MASCTAPSVNTRAFFTFFPPRKQKAVRLRPPYCFSFYSPATYGNKAI